jgi:hypothetical protein
VSRGAIVLALVALPCASLRADPASELARVRAADEDRHLVVAPLGRLRLSSPQQVSAAIGMILAHQPAGFECTATCEYRGALFQLEPGLAGGQLAAGYARFIAGRGHREKFLSEILMGYGFKAVLLRTWGGANLSPQNQTLLGVEGAASIVNVNFSLAVLREVGPAEVADRWRIAGGLGWGF